MKTFEPFYHVLGGKRFRIECRRMKSIDGLCDDPMKPGKCIQIATRVLANRLARNEVLIHEALHASGWHIDESLVEQYAWDAARLIDKVDHLLEERS